MLLSERPKEALGRILGWWIRNFAKFGDNKDEYIK
jgi:hypothetical protein